MKDEKVLQSTVYSEHGTFFVSTIYRESSVAIIPPMTHYETLGFSLSNDETVKRHIVAQEGCGYRKGAIEKHFEIVRQLDQTGIYEEQED